MSPGRYLFNLLVWLDQGLNCVLAGNPDETLSSRAHKAMLKSAHTGKRWGCVLCSLLERIDKGHCARAVEWDEGQGLSPASSAIPSHSKSGAAGKEH